MDIWDILERGGMQIQDIASPLRDRSLGRRLKLAMEDRGVTVRGLASMTGLNPKTITNLRSGKSEGNFATWRVIARALRMTVDELAG